MVDTVYCLSTEDWAAYHDLRRRAAQLMTDAKSAYFNSLLEESRNIWPEVRKYLLQKKAPSTSAQCAPSSQEEAAFADQQNLHFATTASRVTATLRPDPEPRVDASDATTAQSDSSAALPRPPRVVSSAFKLKPATLPELSRALSAMNNSKARGDDGVSLQMLDRKSVCRERVSWMV